MVRRVLPAAAEPVRHAQTGADIRARVGADIRAGGSLVCATPSATETERRQPTNHIAGV